MPFSYSVLDARASVPSQTAKRGCHVQEKRSDLNGFGDISKACKEGNESKILARSHLVVQRTRYHGNRLTYVSLAGLRFRRTGSLV